MQLICEVTDKVWILIYIYYTYSGNVIWFISRVWCLNSRDTHRHLSLSISASAPSSNWHWIMRRWRSLHPYVASFAWASWYSFGENIASKLWYFLIIPTYNFFVIYQYNPFGVPTNRGHYLASWWLGTKFLRWGEPRRFHCIAYTRISIWVLVVKSSFISCDKTSVNVLWIGIVHFHNF